MRLLYVTICAMVLMSCFAPFIGGCRDDKDAVSNKNGVLDFRLDTLGHDRFYLNQNRGKVVVLAFWSTWCIPCKSELVELKSLAAASEYKNVVIAAVCNDPENIDDVKTITKTLGIDYPVLLDKKANVFNKLKMSAVPTTIVIDQSGKISLTRQGYDANTKQQIVINVQSLLAAEKNPG
jgi:peroxiredoxin